MINERNESLWPPVLFDSDLAAILGISVRTLQNARKRATFPFSELPRVGRKPRWSRDHVLAVINGGAAIPSRKRVA